MEKEISGKYMSRISAIIITILLAFGAVAHAAMFDPETALTDARQLVAEGKLDEALNGLLYSLLGANQQQKTDIYIARSKLYAEKGEALSALDEMDSAVRNAPAGSCAIVERAHLYFAFHEPGLAKMDADTALRNGCSSPELIALRARLYLRNGDTINAIDWFYELIYDEDYRFEAFASIGLCYAMLGYPEIAVTFYREALALDDNNARIHAEMGDALTLVGDLDGAIRHYQKSLSLENENGIAANNYAYTLVLAGKVNEAEAVFKKVNEENPTPYSLCNMLEIYLSKDNLQGAAVFGTMCLRAFAADPEMLENERYYASAAQRAVETLKMDRLAIHPLTQVDLAQQHLEHGERLDALAALLMALMMDPHNVDATFQAGELFVEYGKPVRGASYLNMAASMAEPRDPIAEKTRRIISREAMSLLNNRWAASPEPEND